MRGISYSNFWLINAELKAIQGGLLSDFLPVVRLQWTFFLFIWVLCLQGPSSIRTIGTLTLDEGMSELCRGCAEGNDIIVARPHSSQVLWPSSLTFTGSNKLRLFTRNLWRHWWERTCLLAWRSLLRSKPEKHSVEWSWRKALILRSRFISSSLILEGILSSCASVGLTAHRVHFEGLSFSYASLLLVNNSKRSLGNFWFPKDVFPDSLVDLIKFLDTWISWSLGTKPQLHSSAELLKQ